MYCKGRVIALLFHDRGTRKGWVVSSTPWPHFTPEKDLAPILQEAGWGPGPVWMDGKSYPHRDSIPDRPARSVAIPTELPSPPRFLYTCLKCSSYSYPSILLYRASSDPARYIPAPYPLDTIYWPLHVPIYIYIYNVPPTTPSCACS